MQLRGVNLPSRVINMEGLCRMFRNRGRLRKRLWRRRRKISRILITFLVRGNRITRRRSVYPRLLLLSTLTAVHKIWDLWFNINQEGLLTTITRRSQNRCSSKVKKRIIHNLETAIKVRVINLLRKSLTLVLDRSNKIKVHFHRKILLLRLLSIVRSKDLDLNLLLISGYLNLLKGKSQNLWYLLERVTKELEGGCCQMRMGRQKRWIQVVVQPKMQ